MGPLDGVRVLDLSRLLPGPMCSWYLGSLGADVVRVEAPGGHDYTRTMPPLVQGRSVFFASVNRGKRSVAIDVRKPGGRDAFLTLCETADVVVEGFKPGTLSRQGLDPKMLVQRFEQLIVASISGYGQTGPLATEPGHDLNYLGLAGVTAASLHDAQGVPPTPFPIADVAGGALTAALGIAAAVAGVARGGRGRHLDISMTEGALACFGPFLAMAAGEGRAHRPGNEMLTGALGSYRAYRCADDKVLCVGALEPKFWMRIRELAPEVPAMPSPAKLAEVLATRDRDAWVELLTGCCVGPALDATEVAAHPQHVARGAFDDYFGVPLANSPFGWAPSSEVPAVGQHTRELLEPLGVDVDALVAVGAGGVA